MELKSIGVFPPSKHEPNARLFSALEQVYPIRFQPWTRQDPPPAAVLLLDSSVDEANAKEAYAGFPVLAYGNSSSPALSVGAGEREFANDDSMAAVLRGRKLQERRELYAQPLPSTPHTRVLVSSNGFPLWVRLRDENPPIEWVAFSLPKLQDGEWPVQLFNRDRFLELLPLLNFLDRLAAGTFVQKPPLRAAFMFDDPNLRRPSYGYIRYPDLALHAAQHNYHVTIATIPLDASAVHQEAASIFRQNTERLSLLVHGNNHTHRELAREYTASHRQGLVRQALNRIKGFEATAGISVSRVMAAPHGACNAAMARSMAFGGFEAACISHGSLLLHNRNTPWSQAFGLQPAEDLGGLPVIPRFRLSSICETDAVLAAFLGQPIIPVGHHQDVREGLELLERTANVINSFGKVQWCSMERIIRTNYLRWICGPKLKVRLYSRRISITIPAGIEELEIEWLWPTQHPHTEKVTILSPGGFTHESVESGPLCRIAVPKIPVAEIRVQSATETEDGPGACVFPAWAYVRRVLAESRDRLQPLLPRS